MKNTCMKFLCAAALALCAAAFAADEFRVLLAPNPAEANVFRDFSLYCHTDFKATLDRPVVDGAPVIKLTLTEAPATAVNAQRVQFRLTLAAGRLEAGTEYRIHFRCKSDRPAYMSFRCQESATPWSEVTEHAAGGVLLSPDWKYVEYCFTPYEDGNGNPVWVPNFECGFLGLNNSLYIKELVLEALD